MLGDSPQPDSSVLMLMPRTLLPLPLTPLRNGARHQSRLHPSVAQSQRSPPTPVHSPRPSTPTPTAPHPLRVAMPPMDLVGLYAEEQASPRTSNVRRFWWRQGSQDRGSILFRTQSIRPNDARSESVVHAHWVTAATDCL
jgi:hypothetical protein